MPASDNPPAGVALVFDDASVRMVCGYNRGRQMIDINNRNAVQPWFPNNNTIPLCAANQILSVPLLQVLRVLYALDNTPAQWLSFLHACHAGVSRCAPKAHSMILVAHDDVSADRQWITHMQHKAQVLVECARGHGYVDMGTWSTNQSSPRLFTDGHFTASLSRGG